ncbi:hypothetical protein RHSIM_Rhsim13G0163400 [Rhododendron simsii]|uniref:Uncharacterized protein n=1 Tax=Rhododendron simsii TaxID=118357 RepID=A0A834FYE1_RHOSS|nr:hypothetical protein RHSIM_Rhsim13G0163400 [Rhododendron simsii]
MASLPVLLSPQFTHTTFSLLLLLLLLLLLSLLSLTHPHPIHNLLKSQGLPAGLFPDNVKSYDLDPYGRLKVYMDRPCTAKFETRVFFDSVVRANLSYGSLTGLVGLSQEELFLWLPVKDIIVYDQDSGLILFDIGYAHKELSLSLFEDPPVCQPQGVLLKDGGRKELALQVQR